MTLFQYIEHTEVIGNIEDNNILVKFFKSRCEILDEEELTYSFIKYIHLCLVNHAGKYYKKKFNNSHLISYEESVTEALLQNSTGLDRQKSLNPVEFLEEKSLYEMVNDSLTNLSGEELAILYMKYFLKKSDREIGTLIGISSQAVSKRKRKIVQKIRKKI